MLDFKYNLQTFNVITNQRGGGVFFSIEISLNMKIKTQVGYPRPGAGTLQK